jgi:hypothetical protein
MKKLMSIIVLVLITTSAIAQLTLQDMPYFRPYDKRGLNVFETPKVDTIPFDGIKVRLGGAFAQQFQGLRHSNTAQPRFAPNDPQQLTNLNQLMHIGNGFNLATANLNIDVLLADGIRLNLVTYLSSRHHPEAWVKGGFIQMDKLPFLNSALADKIMEKVTIKVGHMQINYGDAQFRRTDNGNAMYNPFIGGNYIMDAFTTEIGGEIIYQHNGFLAVGSVTGGEIQGGVNLSNAQVAAGAKRSPSFIGKIGYDKQLNSDLRVRLTGSTYMTNASARNTLYGGDRAGSRYYMVLDNTLATTAGSFTNGLINPGFTHQVASYVINPFIKFHGFEFFGNIESSTGRAINEKIGDKEVTRTWNQVGFDGVYRIGKNENFYLAARYNKASGPFAGSTDNVSIDRVQLGGGWFVTKNILAKMEYVNQNYNNFAPTDIRNGGRFNGIMIEGVVAF